MKTLRTALLLVGAALLTLGYVMSQVAAFQGWAADYARKVDQPPVQKIALILFVAAITLAFIPDTEENPS